MDTILFNPGRGWFTRLLGRSPLVRPCDRVEALVVLLAFVAVLVATPVAGAVGTAVYSSRSGVYAAQLQTRHTVTATVLHDSEAAARPYSAAFSVAARWLEHGVTHQRSFIWDRPAKAGEHVTVWVDGNGEYAGPPTRTNRAAADAVGAGVVLWMAVVALSAATIALVRLRLDRRRDAAWDRGLRALVDGGGGRTSTEP